MSTKLEFTCVYIVVKNIEKSIEFYTSLFETKIDKKFENRWAQVKSPNGVTIGLLNANYDERLIKSGKDLEKHYDKEFIRSNINIKYTVGNSVVINLRTNDIEKEYKRVKALKPKDISGIQYVNFMFPYHFFIVKDPDGNQIEISDS